MKLLDILTSPWAIQPETLSEITAFYQAHMRGEKVDWAGMESRLAINLSSNRLEAEIVDGVAVLPITGVLGKDLGLFDRLFGGTDTREAGQVFDSMIADPNVTAVVLRIDSPGGTVDGTQDLAQKIFNARGSKPIVSFVDGDMMSAAFWIGAAADRVLISNKTAHVGSVGVRMTLMDQSKFNEQMGVKVTNIVTGRWKAAGSPHQPLSADEKNMFQSMVDTLMGVFVVDLAEFMNTTPEAIMENLGDARILIGQQAIDQGVVDGVSTLDALIKELSQGGGDSLAGSGMSNTLRKAETMSNTATVETPELTAETLKRDHPDLHKQIEQEAYTRGKAEGAQAERDRIQAVREQSMVGHEALIETLMFDGKTTGEQAAVQVLNAHKATLKQHSAALQQDAEASIGTPESVEPADNPEKKKSDVSKLPADQQAKAVWDGNPTLSEEFSSFEAFQAYYEEDAKGNVHIKSDKF